MTTVMHDLGDGSVLVILGVQEPEADEDLDLPIPSEMESRRDSSAMVLGPISDLVADLAVNGFAYGIAGNAAWDLLKHLGSRLRQQGLLGGCEPVSVITVPGIVKAQVVAQGYPQPLIEQIAAQSDGGWLVTGTSGGRRLVAQLDPCGQVLLITIT